MFWACMRWISHVNSGGMGGAWMISGLALKEVAQPLPLMNSSPRDSLVPGGTLGGIRQYSPPKCIVFRLRSVRHVHLSLWRNSKISVSSSLETKLG